MQPRLDISPPQFCSLNPERLRALREQFGLPIIVRDVGDVFSIIDNASPVQLISLPERETAQDNRLFAPDDGEFLRHIEMISEPFNYFLSSQVFSEEQSRGLLHWMEHYVPWRLHHGRFYEQYDCCLNDAYIPDDIAWFLQIETLRTIADRISTLLGARFSDRIEVVGHKLVPGQGIGVHTDNPIGDGETHRLVVQLNSDYQDSNGGHLLFFNSLNAADIHRIFRPVHNSAVGFSLSDMSYHAVSNIMAGVRYTIVFSFWQA